MKFCNKCSTHKPESEFYKKSCGTLTSPCKECKRFSAKENRKKKIEALGEDFYKRERDRSRKAYREKGIGTWSYKLEKDPNYREKYNEQQKKRRKKNPDVYKELSRRDNLRRRSNGGFSKENLEVLKTYNNKFFGSNKYHCEYCTLEISGSYDVDHLVPVSKGGSGKTTNLVLSCLDCNRGSGGKFDKLLENWKPELQWYFTFRNELFLV